MLAAAGFAGRIPTHLRALARFEHDGAVTQERKVISESRETTFDFDIADTGQLECALAQLADQLGAALERQGVHGRTVGIKVRLDDFSTHTRARTLSAPVSGGEPLRRVALELLRRFDAPRPVRLLGVRVAGLEQVEAEPRQLALGV